QLEASWRKDIEWAEQQKAYKEFEREMFKCGPFPPEFPAKPSKFMDLIVAGRDFTEAHGREATLFAIAVARRGGDAYVFEHDIEDRNAWRDLVRDFRQWRERQTQKL